MTMTEPITGRKVAMLADVAAERRELADWLATLDDAAWATRSLCRAWNVHELLAHLTLSITQKVLPTMWRVLKARGDFDGAEARMAIDYAAEHAPGELLTRFRHRADADSRFVMGGKLDPLTDILVHGQDMARPLGHDRPMPVDRVLPALNHVWGSRFYGTAKRFAGLRVVAADADWSTGEGPQVRGLAGDILLAATGRASGAERLSGPGAAELARRLG